jgi:soluble lytic murein transglycosylase-like protein
MKFPRYACIVGAVMVLSPPMAREPTNVSGPVREPVPADKSVRADNAQASVTVLKAASIKLASLEDARANPVAPIPPFALTSAYPKQMSSSHEKTTQPAETPTATLRRTMDASAEALPERFLKALAAADSIPAVALPPTRLAYAAIPGITRDPMSYTLPPHKRETPDLSYLADYAYSEVPPPQMPADTVLRALKEIPEGAPIEEVKRAAKAFGLDVTFMEAVAKIESDFDPKQRTGSYVGLFQLSKYEFDRYGSGEITNARDNAIAGAYKFAVAAIMFELQTHKKATPADL